MLTTFSLNQQTSNISIKCTLVFFFNNTFLTHYNFYICGNNAHVHYFLTSVHKHFITIDTFFPHKHAVCVLPAFNTFAFYA